MADNSVDNELFYALGDLLEGHPTDEVIPLLIVASARALVEHCGDDVGQLGLDLSKFNDLLLQQVMDMADGRKPESHRN